MSLTEAAGVWDFATDAITQTFKTFNFILSSSSDDNFFASLTNVEPQKCLLYWEMCYKQSPDLLMSNPWAVKRLHRPVTDAKWLLTRFFISSQNVKCIITHTALYIKLFIIPAGLRSLWPAVVKGSFVSFFTRMFHMKPVGVCLESFDPRMIRFSWF